MVLASLIIAAATAGAAPRPTHQDCRGDKRIACWEAERRTRIQQLFGTRPIEDYAGVGAQLRRAYYVDGYARDVVAIEFVRAPGADPTVVVRFPDAGSERPRQPLTAPIPLAEWNSLLEASRLFDRALVKAPEPRKPGDNTITICVHPWTYTVEAADPPEGDEPALIRRRTEDGCDGGNAQAFGIQAYKVAAKLIPPCDLLNRDDYRNEAELLSTCGILEGDRLAGAAVVNAADAFRTVWDADDAVRLSGLFDYRTKIDWAGQVYSGNDAAQFWARKASEGGRGHLSLTRVIGESATRVRLRGLLSR